MESLRDGIARVCLPHLGAGDLATDYFPQTLADEVVEYLRSRSYDRLSDDVIEYLRTRAYDRTPLGEKPQLGGCWIWIPDNENESPS